MAKFPEPPAPNRLAAIAPAIRMVAAGTRLWRIYQRGGSHPTAWNAFRFFGPFTARFDHHLSPPRLQERGILYAARSFPTCIAEFFQATRTIDVRRGEPWIVAFDLVRDVPALDLAGPWPTRAGASTAICSGPRPRAQRWSCAAYEAYPDIEGLVYGSSMNAGELAVALYERAGSSIPAAAAFDRPLTLPELHDRLRRSAARFGYAMPR